MHTHSDANPYTQIAHTCFVRKVLDAYLCAAQIPVFLVQKEKYQGCAHTRGEKEPGLPFTPII